MCAAGRSTLAYVMLGDETPSLVWRVWFGIDVLVYYCLYELQQL